MRVILRNDHNFCGNSKGELKMKSKKHGANKSEILCRVLEEKIRQKELEKIKILLEESKKGMHYTTKEKTIKVIRELRKER